MVVMLLFVTGHYGIAMRTKHLEAPIETAKEDGWSSSIAIFDVLSSTMTCQQAEQFDGSRLRHEDASNSASEFSFTGD